MAEPWQNVVLDASASAPAESRSGSGASGWDALIDLGARVASGVAVSPESALSLTSAFSAINTLSTDLSALPIKLYRKRKDGGRDEQGDHPAAVLLASSPDGESTSMRWRQASYGHLFGWGNGYGEIAFDREGYPTGAYLMDPRKTCPKRRPQDGRLYYDTGSGTLPPYRVLHFAGLGFDGLVGYSPIAKAREAVGLALAAESYGAGLFGNGSRPLGVLKSPKALDGKAIANIRESWQAIHGGAKNSGKTAILENGLEWQAISINPEDAQFLATRQFQVVEIARMFRLPPSKIGDMSDAHYNNIEASNLDYMTTTLMPWCEQIEQELNRKLLMEDERKAGFYFEHNMTAFLRGDMKSRAEFYTRMRDLGVLSPNQICGFENLNPIGPEGDLRLVPLNMVSLAEAGKPKPAAAPAQPAAAGADQQQQDEEPADG
jgi:HK97 family phage portal protein